MDLKLKELGVNLGYGCNFHCAHCSITEAPSVKLSATEAAFLARTIKKHKFKSLLLIGGEPTLYVDIANEMLSQCGDLSGISVRMTTNGHFAGTKNSAIRMLASFAKLDKVQLSYDKFHAGFLPFRNIANLFDACRALRKKFSVVVAIESPMDILLAEKIKKAGNFVIGIQKVLPIGRAKINGIKHPYPSLDRRVLRKSCPNHGKIMYFCGRGFSACCSSLVFDSHCRGVVHKTIEAHLNSGFYKTIVLSKFAALAKKLGVAAAELRPEHSSPCNLCEYLFRVAEQRRHAGAMQ